MMDVREARVRKREFERELCCLVADKIKEFSEETGLVVSGLSVETSTCRSFDGYASTIITGMKLEVEL